jgi:DNA-binding FrmR family transcriptional regulator
MTEYRRKIAGKIYKYLEDRVNCTNILEHINTKDSVTDKITIELIPVTLETIKYTTKDKSDNDKQITKKELEKIYDRFEYISAANHTGFEYFPYLYGVLECDDSEQVYVLHESFDGTLDKLFKDIEQGSDWYEIVFQYVIIHYYMSNISKISYSNSGLDKHYFQKYKFPKKKQYTLNDYKFEMYHKNLVVLWDFNLNSDISNTSNILTANIEQLLKFINENKDNFKNQPSQRIMKLLNDIKQTVNIDDIPKLLDSYYNAKKEIDPITRR